MVALVVTSLVALVAHGVFRASTEAGRAVVSARRSLDHTSNADRWLIAAFLSLEVGATAPPFEGRAETVRFATWLETPDGWFEPAVMTIRLEGRQLVASLNADSPIVLADSLTAVRFDYLLEPGANAAWVTEWMSSLNAPVGVRIRTYYRGDQGRVVGDTTLFPIKERQ
jgi:hypothetical protein